MADKDDLAEAKEAFKLSADAESENRACALDDLRFARLAEQWPQDILKRREKEARPCLTINRMPSFIRQVVNDARQNKPSIKVKPVDSNADPLTAEVINGLIRNIEYTSNADVAYDTAAEFAVTMGFGYIRVSIDFARDDTFDKDLTIQRVSNPFSVYGDPHSTAADSSDWNTAFVVDRLSEDAFSRKYKGAVPVDWGELGYTKLEVPWMENEEILVAEWWKREEVEKELLLLSNGEVMYAEAYQKAKDLFDALGVTVIEQRPTRGYKVTQRIMTGAEILEKNEWAGRYIPLIPVYGEEVNVEGKRYFRSLIRDAKDAQRMFNYWRTTTTELVALAPKAPFIGPRGSFETDVAKWESANTEAHPYIEYDPVPGGVPPQRQPFSGVPAGALQEALNASDDMKSIMGLYDASLGARSNETSGVAINARKREGDVSTFHFIDNLSRGIKHTGRVLLDLIPLVYNKDRVIRVLGAEGEVQTVRIGQPQPMQPAQPPMPAAPMQPIPGQDRIYDLTAGKYDLAVEAGPSFTTQREEAVTAITEIIRSFPQAAPVLGPMLIKMMDFPNAQEIAQKLEALLAQGGNDAEKQKLQQQVQTLTATLNALKASKDIEQQKVGIDAMQARTDAYAAETDRIEAVHRIVTPPPPPRPMAQPR